MAARTGFSFVHTAAVVLVAAGMDWARHAADEHDHLNGCSSDSDRCVSVWAARPDSCVQVDDNRYDPTFTGRNGRHALVEIRYFGGVVMVVRLDFVFRSETEQPAKVPTASHRFER